MEIGNLFAIILFFYSALLANLNIKDKDLRWNWWFFVTLIFVCYKFFVPAYVFSQNFGLALFPSVAGSRDVLIVFLGRRFIFYIVPVSHWRELNNYLSVRLSR